MWLADSAPRNSESQALSYAIKYIRRVRPRVAWIQSFADERCGAWGVVYQAANFLYLRHHWTSFYELDGETYHEMLLSAHKKGGHCGERDLLKFGACHSLAQGAMAALFLVHSSAFSFELNQAHGPWKLQEQITQQGICWRLLQ